MHSTRRLRSFSSLLSSSGRRRRPARSLGAAVAIALAAVALGADSGAESHGAEIERLQTEMREAAQNLEFERAAELRDEIRELGGEPDREVLVGAGVDVAAAPPREVKWGPHLDIGGKFGNERLLGRGDLFIPFWQDPRSLAFLDVRAMGDDNDTIEGNFGVGFRRMFGEKVILGGYGFFDLRSSDRGGDRNEFISGTVGIEALTEDFDFRVNGYIPEDETKNAPNKTKASLSGGSLFVKRGRERALYGVDGELGVRVPFLPEPLWDTRLYAGGFYFDAPQFDEVLGPRGRAEMRLYDLPLLPANSRLTLTGEVSHDEVRDVVAFGGVKVRIPFYGFWNAGHGSGPQGGLTRLERRMVDPVVREVDIVTNAEAIDEEPAVNPKTGNRIEQVRFADAAGGGDGQSPGSPDELADAIAGAGTDGVVVVDAGTGDVLGNVTLEDGQSLLGGGANLLVVGANSGTQAMWQAPGERPTLVDGLDNGSTIIVLAENNLIGGVDLDGLGNDADGIAGTNFEQFMLMDTEIRDTDVAVRLEVNDDGEVGTYQGVGNRFLENRVVDGSDGAMTLLVEDGGRLVASIEKSVFRDNGEDGIDALVEDGTLDVTISDSEFTGNANDGVDLEQEPGSTLYVDIRNSLFEGNTDDGLEVTTVNDGSTGNMTFMGELVGNRFVGNGPVDGGGADGVNHGVEIFDDSQGITDVTWYVEGNEFAGNGEDGFDLEVDVELDFDSDPNVVLNLWTDFVGNRFVDNGNDGLDFDFFGEGPVSATWGARIANNDFVGNAATDFDSDIDPAGFSGEVEAGPLADLDFDWLVTDNLFQENGNMDDGGDGANVHVSGFISATSLTGSVQFVENRFVENQDDGLELTIFDVDRDVGVIQFDADVIGNRFALNGDDAVFVDIFDAGEAIGTLRFVENTVDSPGDDGFDLGITDSDYDVVLGGNEVRNAGGVALEIDADAQDWSSQVNGDVLGNTFLGSMTPGADCGGECDFDGASDNDGSLLINGVDEAIP